MKKNKIISICTLLLVACCFSCKKAWLDAKPNKSLAVPSTIKDYQSLLDGTQDGSSTGFNDHKNFLNEICAGDFYVSGASWNSVSAIERNCYVWAPNIYGDEDNYSEWSVPYIDIFYTNIALDGIEKIIPGNNNEQLEWNQVKGGALFHRAFRHYDVAMQFCKPFNKNSAHTDLGIPLRLQSDYNVLSVRSTVEETYNQILSDLKQAAQILPIATPINDVYKCRPNKAAANAMIARVYLSMSNYDSAWLYADKCLQAYGSLMDFNTELLPSGTYQIPRFNKEVLFHCRVNTWSLPLPTVFAFVDSGLYRLYDVNDLRRDDYYYDNGGPRFRGSYDQTGENFGGLATDEIYLIRAECNARFGNVSAALKDIDTLLRKRWRNSVPFQPLSVVDANDALKKILIERRKELCFRGLRWTDLRRLNFDPQFAVTLRRVVNGQTYTLPPNSPLYVFPIPPIVIQLTGMQQNPR